MSLPHPHPPGSRLIWILTLLAALFAAYTAYRTTAPNAPMVTLVTQDQADLQTEWVSGGLRMRVNTYLKNHDDDPTAAAAAHKAKVDALIAEYPPDA